MTTKTMQRFNEAKKILKNMEECEIIPIKKSQITTRGKFTTLDASKLGGFIASLSSFLPSGESIIGILHKEYSKVKGFNEWYKKKQEVIKSDEVLNRIKKLRNKSVHEGSIKPNLIIGLNLSTSQSEAQHFLGDKEKNTIVDLCKEYLNKIEKLIKEAETKFGRHIIYKEK